MEFFEETPDGLTVHLEDGTSEDVDVLVGADSYFYGNQDER